jgi:hypothetical protein
MLRAIWRNGDDQGPRGPLEGALALSYEQSNQPGLGRAPQTRIRGKEINVGEIQNVAHRNDAGYIAIPRRIFEDPLLQDDAYFRAFLRLVSEAAWKIRRVKITNGRRSEIIELERGQLSHSRSYMANSWGWSEKRVRTFLRRLEKGGMIDVQAGRLQTVITICNYDIYQGAPDDAGRRTGKQIGRQRADKGPEEEYIKEENNRDSAFKTAKNPKGWPEDGFERWYARYPRKKDRGAAEKAYAKARARGLIGFDELLAATARYAEWTNDKDPQFIKYPATWLNADSYLNEPDRPKRSTPEATIAEPSLGPQSAMQIGRIGFAIIGPKASGRPIGDRAPANLAAKFPRTSSMGAHMDNPTAYDTPTCPHLRPSVIAGRYGDTDRYRNDDANLDGIGREHSHKPKETFRLIEGPTPSAFRFYAITPRRAGRLRQQVPERWAQPLVGCAQ